MIRQEAREDSLDVHFVNPGATDRRQRPKGPLQNSKARAK